MSKVEITALYGKSLSPHCSLCRRADVSHYCIKVTYDEGDTMLICEDCLSTMNQKYREADNKAADRLDGNFP
jgi:hypothetical protein